MTVGAVLFSEMTPGRGWEDEFNAWYDREHIPLRMAVPGFIGAQRYRDTGTDGYLAIYDMTAVSVLTSNAYAAVKNNPSATTTRMLKSVTGFTRYTGELASWQVRDGVADAELLASPIAYSVLFAVPAGRQAEFDDWYTQDHVPTLLEEPAWLGCRRYRIVSGDPGLFTHLAIHHLTSAEALQSPARARARASAWRDRLAGEAWFKGSYSVFSRLGGRFHAKSGA